MKFIYQTVSLDSNFKKRLLFIFGFSIQMQLFMGLLKKFKLVEFIKYFFMKDEVISDKPELKI